VLVTAGLAESKLSLIVGFALVLIGASFIRLALRNRKKERPF